MLWKKKKKIADLSHIVTNEDTIRALAPSGIFIAKDHILMDDKYYRFFTVVNYPDYAYLMWLSHLNMKGVTWSYHIKDLNIDELIDYTSKVINKKDLQREQSRNPQTKIKAAKDIQSSKMMLERMMSDSEKTIDFTIVVRASAGSLEALDEMTSTMKSKASTYKIPLKAILFNQEGLLLKNLPFNLDVDIRYSNPMPIANVAAGFPFLDNSINDEKGVYLGKDDQGNNIIVDFNLKNDSRYNSNIAIIGDSGSGKTTLASDIIYQEHLFGSKHYIVDVEGEYLDLAKKLGGTVLDMSGAGYSFNPFEIFLEEDYIEDEKEEAKAIVPPLSLHIKHLKNFFLAYDDTLTKHEGNELSMSLLAFYEKNGMTLEMTLTELKKFPQLFLKDFFFFLEKRRDGSINSFETEQLNKVLSSIKEISVGVDAYLWNRESNLGELGDFVVFDIYKMRDLDEDLLRTQYFLIATRIWAECVKNREKNANRSLANQGFIRIIFDELHKILNNEFIAKFIRGLAKMVRKYDAGLLTITQATTDYLHEKIKNEGRDILSSSIYKFIFGQKDTGLIDTKTIFSLNPQEIALLEASYRGVCLAIFGNYKTKMTNEVPDFILDLIDKKRRLT